MSGTPYRDLVQYHAQTRPHRVAVRNASTGRDVSYLELHERAQRLARHLQNEGVGRGDRVALMAYNCAEFFELQYACSRIGAVTVPLNWRLSVDELEAILQDCNPCLLVHDADFAAVARTLQSRNAIGPLLAIDGGSAESSYEQALASASVDPVWAQATHEDLCLIMYTSGTSGRSKGVLITHGMVWWNTANVGFPSKITSSSVQLVILPLFHIGGINSHANPILHAGGTVVLQHRFDAGDVLKLIGDPKWGVTRMTGVPAQYQFLANHPDFASTDLSRIEFLGMGGSPCALATIEAWTSRGAPLGQGYGLTEASPGVTLLDAGEIFRKAGSIGKPMPYTQVRVVDESGKDVPPGDTGEMWLRGPNITPGYWNAPEATAAAFEDGWFKTGDAARCDAEGFYYIVDRVKDMYISGGENVYPAEVENVIYQLSEVAEAAVIGVADQRWGESGFAVVVLHKSASLDAQAILRYCAARLAKFKVPLRVAFVTELPRNAAGKVLKRELRQRHGIEATGLTQI
ncbi:acyl-CoA synthetase [Ottowia caeni]|uniref:acyl-CoA synthetase n=1 Tax=Ottowia caeni TaxID=2870339 RepID=UPI001E38CCA4|nr:long-chain fatty acid--CoA ligase [Ottowia caeni]